MGLFVATPLYAQTTNTQNQNTLQKTLDALKVQLSKLYSQLPAAGVLGVTASTAKIDPTTFPITAPGGCGQTLTPIGTLNQTIRCDGRSWVADSNIINTGNRVGIGFDPGNNTANTSRLTILDNDNTNFVGAFTGITLSRFSGGVAAVRGIITPGPGSSPIAGGAGVLGQADMLFGTAVQANQEHGGYGFYQKGSYAMNNFESMLSVGYVNGPITQTQGGVKIRTNGGIQIDTIVDQPYPGCTDSNRGTFWFVKSGSGVKDTVLVCAKDATDAYAWRTLY